QVQRARIAAEPVVRGLRRSGPQLDRTDPFITRAPTVGAFIITSDADSSPVPDIRLHIAARHPRWSSTAQAASARVPATAVGRCCGTPVVGPQLRGWLHFIRLRCTDAPRLSNFRGARARDRWSREAVREVAGV